ncbi:hypothetical protein J1614_000640 [Plenodomus biglobosus]|nr:hypothetical protein J1614_000640 [Plenodomus biglobosus]
MQFSLLTALTSLLVVASAVAVEKRQVHKECVLYSGGNTAYNFYRPMDSGHKLCCNYLGNADNCCQFEGPKSNYNTCVQINFPASS